MTATRIITVSWDPIASSRLQQLPSDIRQRVLSRVELLNDPEHWRQPDLHRLKGAGNRFIFRVGDSLRLVVERIGDKAKVLDFFEKQQQDIFLPSSARVAGRP